VIRILISQRRMSGDSLKPGQIQIFVKGIGGKTLAYTIHEDALVHELFKMVNMKEGIPIPEIRLIYAGKQLEEQKDGKTNTLRDYGIKKESTLYLVMRLRGGMEEKAYGPDDMVETTEEVDMITWEDSPDNPRAKMPCGHAITPESLTQYCRSILDANKFIFYCPYVGKTVTPHVYCRQEWPYVIVRRLALLSDVEIKYFEEKISENFLLKASGIQKCPKCESFCQRIDTKNKRVICTYCSKETKKRYEFCWSCLHDWNGPGIDKCGNEECTGIDPRLSTLKQCVKKTVVGVAKVPSIRACPKCGMLIEHTSACKHMVCPCGAQFCFICLKEKSGTTWSCGTFNSVCPIASIQTKIVGVDD